MTYPTLLSGIVQENDSPSEWGWVRYERTHWQRDTGEKMYIAILRAEYDPYHFTDLHVRFWAKHIRLKLSAACKGKKTAAEVVKLLLEG